MDNLCEINTYMTLAEFKKLKKKYPSLELINDDVKKRCYVAIVVAVNMESVLSRFAGGNIEKEVKPWSNG